MRLVGPLQKMFNEIGDPIRYSLRLGDHLLMMNALIGKNIEVKWLGNHQCFCGHTVPTVHDRNFCRECFFTRPEASMTIMKPELSQAHLGIEERDLEFEKRLQLQPHYVYLAKTSEIKVGVTRKTQMPYRWIDQGASEATILLEVPNRYLAGEAEVLLKDHFADKTSWQAMLKGTASDADLQEARVRALEALTPELREYAWGEYRNWTLKFPLEEHPTKVKSLNLRKEPHWSGQLKGIKGQYLITDAGVFNVRSHEGFIVEFGID
ncbi:MAG: hypothetical protein RL754_481 [Bacteroidota bacterium]|jgi:hypothetical protein